MGVVAAEAGDDDFAAVGLAVAVGVLEEENVGRVADPDAAMTDGEEDEISTGVKKLLNDALTRAEESPQPDPGDLLNGVYATPEDLDTPHHK